MSDVSIEGILDTSHCRTTCAKQLGEVHMTLLALLGCVFLVLARLLRKTTGQDKPAAEGVPKMREVAEEAA